MAFTEFGMNSPQAVKRWSTEALRETFGKIGLKGMIGTRPDSAIKLMTELDKDAGDEIKFDLLVQDRGNGVNGDNTLEGFEDDLDYFQDILRVDQKRKGTAFKRMSQQRTVHDLRRDGRFSLTEWGKWFIEGSLFAHFAGVAGDDGESVAGALGATTSGDVDWAGNTLGIDASNAIDAGHLVDGATSAMTLDFIDDAIAKAKTQNPRVPPIMINGQPKYVLYMHPLSVRSLQTQATLVRSWTAIREQASARSNGNPIYTGALGEHNGVILRESEFVPRVGDDTYNILLGACGGCIAFGNAWEKTSRVSGGGGSQFEIIEEQRDYKNRKGMALAMCVGFKRSTFDGKAFGNMVIKTDEPAV